MSKVSPHNEPVGEAVGSDRPTGARDSNCANAVSKSHAVELEEHRGLS